MRSDSEIRHGAAPDVQGGWQPVARDAWRRFRHSITTEVVLQAVKAFQTDRVLLHASALTYTTLLSLVPGLALTFSILKGLGVQRRLEPMIMDRISAGSEEIAQQILTYIDNTNVTSLGTIGVITLLVTVVLVLSNIERAFNHIWGVDRPRPVIRKFADFFSVVLVFPFLLLAASWVNAFVESRPAFLERLPATNVMMEAWRIALQFTPHFFMVVALTFLYLFMPNTRVRFGAALAGGLVGGIALQVAQDQYIHFQIGATKYNAIYGAMAQLPVFLVWTYLSWAIALFGAEISWAFQQEQRRRRISGPLPDASVWECLHIEVLRVVVERFQTGLGATAVSHVAAATGVPTSTCTDILDSLTDVGLTLSDAGDPCGYLPSKPAEATSLCDVREALHTVTDRAMPAAVTPRFGAALAAGHEVMALRVSLADLVHPSSDPKEKRTMAATESTMLRLGTPAPDFSLPDVSGGELSLADTAGRPLLVIFLCRHCPFVQWVRRELARLGRDYGERVAIVGISANDADHYPDDHPESLAEMVVEWGLTFPVLYDESQAVAKAYRAACTPDFFLFGADHRLVYRGQLDDSRPNSGIPVTGQDLRAALDAVLGGTAVAVEQHPSLGCNIKWKPGNEPEYFG
jgi:membrane protein